MKKGVVIIVILVILGGVVFGFGYVPLRVEPGQQLLMFSKTSGWDSEPISPGEFSWRWQLLIPTNVTFYTISSQPRRVAVQSTTALPSADLYREFLEGTPILEERISMRIRYRISDAGVLSLAPSGIDPGSLERWYADMDDQISRTALQAVRLTFRRLLEGDTDAVDFTTPVVEAVESAIALEHEEIILESVIIEDVLVPDIALYRLARETYGAVQRQRQAALENMTASATTARALQNERLETLARYGEILDRHPILLEYLEIAARHEEDPLDLRGLESVVE